MATGGRHDSLSALWFNTSYVCERGNICTLAHALSFCCCYFALIYRVHVGPFRECGTHCNDREPDFLSSRLVENIDFALSAHFGRHFLPLVFLFLLLPAAARPLIKWLLDNVHAWRWEVQEACENVCTIRLLSLQRRCANYLYFTHWLIITYKRTLTLQPRAATPPQHCSHCKKKKKKKLVKGCISLKEMNIN